MEDDKPLIIFDLDGTLIYDRAKYRYVGRQTRNPHYISLRDQIVSRAVELGVPPKIYEGVEERMAARWNATLQYLFNVGSSRQRILEVMSAVNEPILAHETEEHENCDIFSDTIDTLSALKNAGYGIAIATNTSETELLKMYEKFGFGKYVGEYVTRVLTDYLKPRPEPIIKILKKFNARHAVCVGDADHDAESFRAACKALEVDGTFVLVNTRGYDSKTIESIEVDATIYSPGKLLPLLQI